MKRSRPVSPPASRASSASRSKGWWKASVASGKKASRASARPPAVSGARSRISSNSFLRRLDADDQKRRREQGADEERERQRIAAGRVEQKSEERRAARGEDIGKKHPHAAHRAERHAAEKVRPHDFAQHEAPAETDAVNEKSRVDEAERRRAECQRS